MEYNGQFFAMICFSSDKSRRVYESHKNRFSQMTVEITQKPIDVNELIERTRDENAGALVTFQGTVRKMTGDLEVESLTYDAYGEMAVKKIVEIVVDAKKKFNVIGINIIHRIGKVDLTQDSVAICCSAPHRKEAFLACEYVIDEIKVRVPIWKKDNTPEGKSRWRD